MNLQQIAKENRKAETDVNEMFYTRWSPRSMSGETLTKEELLPLFEAAKWSPSSFNEQPWRFVVGLDEQKDKLMEYLVGFNQQWCKNAAALVVILSHKTFSRNDKPNANHSFDTGAAWMALSLEGARRDLVVHGMAGFDKEKIRAELQIPEEYEIDAMCAIGKLGKKEDLPEGLQDKEIPSQRKAISEIVNFDGSFNW